MNSKRQKIANIINYVYGIGILIALFVGALSFIGYIVAFIIGGETATEICNFIYKEFYPHLFSFSSIIVLFGLVKMYVVGEKSMVPTTRPKKELNRETNERK